MILRKNLKRLKGDASHRTFFRNKKKGISSIFVYAKKDKKLNLLTYDAINQILLKNDILAPKLLSENYHRNYIEIEDFGDQSIFYILKKNLSNKSLVFKKIIKLLIKIQSIKERQIINFKKKIYKIPIYKNKILFDEAKLFFDWYIVKKLSKSDQLIFKKKYIKIINNLIKKLKLKNNIFVHRDFHVSNLIKYKNHLAVIDSQDAVKGNIAYDLASLIDDVRITSSNKLKKEAYNYYVKSKNKSFNQNFFLNDFEILSVLRNIKIIGIFTRLAVRDKKRKYLRLIPHAWKLIDYRMQNKKQFKILKQIFDENFSKKIRNLK